jgi:hypothetical protein
MRGGGFSRAIESPKTKNLDELMPKHVTFKATVGSF